MLNSKFSSCQNFNLIYDFYSNFCDLIVDYQNTDDDKVRKQLKEIREEFEGITKHSKNPFFIANMKINSVK